MASHVMATFDYLRLAKNPPFPQLMVPPPLRLVDLDYNVVGTELGFLTIHSCSITSEYTNASQSDFESLQCCERGLSV